MFWDFPRLIVPDLISEAKRCPNRDCLSTRHVACLWEKLFNSSLLKKTTKLLLQSWWSKSAQSYNSLVSCVVCWNELQSRFRSDVASFLFYEEGYQASSLNAFRSAISSESAHDQVDGVTIGKRPLLYDVLKGAFYTTCRPSSPRYTAARNVQAILKYLKSIGLSSTYFPFTQVSHLQACNAAGINYTFLFCRPSNTAANFVQKRWFSFQQP